MSPKGINEWRRRAPDKQSLSSCRRVNNAQLSPTIPTTPISRTMKVLLVLALVALVGGAAAQLYRGESYSHTNGKPGCRTAAEFNVKWANNYDNLRYWLCTDAGAVSYVCPTEFLFHYDRQCCVRWNFWTWSAPFDPPTLADV